MGKKKVLITYATYGSGHKTVAEYIYNYLNAHSDYEVKIIDMMDYGNTIGQVSQIVHETNTKNIGGGFFFSLFYKFLNSKMTTMPYKAVVKSLFKNKKLQKAITDYNPDLLISTHFFGNIIVGIMNKQKLLNTKIISIITDYTAHEIWIRGESQINAYIVTNDIVKNELISKNVSPKKIYTYGIPISEKFKNVGDTTITKMKYKVNNDKKTILFFAGGSIGSKNSLKYLKKLLLQNYDINIIFVCGKNEKLKRTIEKIVKKNKYKNITVLGFSKEVNNLLSISDLVITKPGGISITECLEMKKPMLLIPGIGGNEIYNAKFVCKNGYGIMCRTPQKLAKTLSNVLKRKYILNNIKRKLDKYEHNNSVEKIYKLSKTMLKK